MPREAYSSCDLKALRVTQFGEMPFIREDGLWLGS